MDAGGRFKELSGRDEQFDNVPLKLQGRIRGGSRKYIIFISGNVL